MILTEWKGIPCYIYEGVVMGENVSVGPFAVIGKPPKVPSGATSRKPSTELTSTYIEENCVIGAGATIYHGCYVGANTLIGDGAKLRDHCVLGKFCIVGMNAKIGFKTTVGNKVKIMDLCNISGNMTIEDGVFIGQGTMCANDNSMGRLAPQGKEWTSAGPVIKKGARIGQNSSLLPGVEIGENAIVAAGAVVTKSVASRTLVAGVPAVLKRWVFE